MGNFFILWFGRLVSVVGTRMTDFALGIWVWEQTESATAMAFVALSSQLPRIATTLYAGVIVDQYNRKFLILLGDIVAFFSTLVIGLLLFTENLQVWHIYLLGAFDSSFKRLRGLAYGSSVAMLVPQEQYVRATSMNSVFNYGSNIIAPGLAGLLYPFSGLAGIVAIDLMSFVAAIATLSKVSIPQPSSSEQATPHLGTIGQRFSFGFRYLRQHQGLQLLLLLSLLFGFAHDLGGTMLEPMILARTDNNTTVLGSIVASAGIGGVLSATLLSIHGGPRKRINSLLIGMMGAGICKTIFGLAQTPLFWLPAQFASSLNFPLIRSTRSAIWLDEVPPAVQGRVFSARGLSQQLTSAMGTAIAGPLADYLFQPAMQSNGWLAPWLSIFFGTGDGAGFALLYTLSAMGLFLIGVSGYWLRLHRTSLWTKQEVKLGDD